MDYLIHVSILVGIAAAVGLSYNLIAGYTGLLSICHAAIYGLGSYTAALLALKMGWPFLVVMGCAILFCICIGVLIGWPSLRMRNDDFVIATFAFQILLVSLLQNLVSFTGGPMGLPGIPEPKIINWTISTPLEHFYITLIILLLILFIIKRIVSAPFGRVLQGIREDEIFVLTTGKDISLFKMRAFVLSAALVSIPGAMYAYYISFIDPSSFNIMESVFVISVVVIGGAGSLWGPIVGAIVLVVLPEVLRFIGLPNSISANMRQIIYGGLLVAFMMWRPQGLLGKYAFRSGEAKE